MSRAVKTDYEFDKKTFADLLSEAKGKRTQTEFAEQCQISLAHLNRYLNQKKDNPPIPTTIRHIADVAQGGVSYDELMRTAGYNPEKYREKFTTNRMQAWNMKQNCLNSIVSAFSQRSFEWRSLPQESLSFFSGDNGEIHFDWGVRLFDNDFIDNWYFKYKDFPDGDEFIDSLKSYYNDLLYCPLPPKTKLSIAVCTEQEYKDVKRLLPQMPFYISAVLVDEVNSVIIKEEYIKTALEQPDDVLNIYTLSDVKG